MITKIVENKLIEVHEMLDWHYKLIQKQDNWSRNVEDNFIETLDHLIKIDTFLRNNLTPEELKIYKAMDKAESSEEEITLEPLERRLE